MTNDELAEEMGIDIFCKGCRLMPIDCVCGFTDEDWKTDPEDEGSDFTLMADIGLIVLLSAVFIMGALVGVCIGAWLF